MIIAPEIFARTQFAFTVSFHIIFPTISIGLASFLAIVEGLWLKTKDQIFLQIYKFWLSIFAMAFGVGVVTGIVLSFEFGLGFAKFAQMAGPAIGPMIALEVLTSFFLEAGFLGIMLFGLNRVGPRLHYLATRMVALGTLMSASWIFFLRLLGVSRTNTRKRMERMTASKRSWFWFLGLYVVSLALYAVGTLLVRSLVNLAF